MVSGSIDLNLPCRLTTADHSTLSHMLTEKIEDPFRRIPIHSTVAFFNLTPGPPPFSGMNSTPACSRAERMAAMLLAIMAYVRKRSVIGRGAIKPVIGWEEQ
jgi:hypothetical protein